MAITQFTVCHKAAAHTLGELSDYSYPSSPKLGIEFAFKEKLAKTLPQLFLHRFVPSLMDLVFERKFSFLCRDFAILQRLDCRRKKVKPAVFRSQIILYCYAT